MKIFDNRRLFFAIILIFTVVNLAFVMTVIYKINNIKNERNYRHDRGHRNGSRFMAKEIGFDEAQQELFTKSRREFREKAEPLHKNLGELNSLLINEVTSTNPDTLKCRELSNQIGIIHTRIKIESYNHFLKVRSIAKPTQVNKLNRFYRELLLENNRYYRRPKTKSDSTSIN